jgi:hypothetical protein
VVLVIECCGAGKRVFAVNSIYYMFICAEFVAVGLAWQLRHYRHLITAYTCVTCSLVFYFWLVPESPRWLISKQQYSKAYRVLARIARSNKKSTECLSEIKALADLESKKSGKNVNDEPNDHLEMDKLKSDNIEDTNNNNNPTDAGHSEPMQVLSIGQTLKVLFKSKKIVLCSLVLLLNWLSNFELYLRLKT